MERTHWTLDSLNKAYQQGYMVGLTGRGAEDCCFQNDVLVAAWESGWDDGFQNFQQRQRQQQDAARQEPNSNRSA
ncbi:ribosome modulation factor [Saccharospirillum mangrovi]|uniref:ribosome modulation factor n=1 Tax=Saccharospirillum mangrovi TaxID=2161747 RepID=UPI000D3791AB|nr:ribosome modulation factor [Saccharospirillum mangrovi]